jgi:hypothetical protein
LTPLLQRNTGWAGHLPVVFFLLEQLAVLRQSTSKHHHHAVTAIEPKVKLYLPSVRDLTNL